MRLLCVDTSSKEIGIGLFSGSKAISEEYITASRNYNSVLMPAIKRVLESAGLAPGDIDVFASTLGPGSFTGIRVGMAAMKGLAHAAGGYFAGATTLEILARQSFGKGPCWAVLDAGRGEVYAAFFDEKKEGAARPVKFILESVEKTAGRIKKGAAVKGLSRDAAGGNILRFNGSIRLISQEHISMAAFNDIITGRRMQDKRAVYSAAPVYIRASEAEESLKRKKNAAQKQAGVKRS